MTRIIKALVLFVILALFEQAVFAQSNVNQQVMVVKAYEPVIGDAFKISELPKIADTNKVYTKFNYEIITNRHATTFEPKPIKSARLVSEPLTKLYYGHAKVAFGSNLSPLAQLYLGSQRSESLNWNVMLHHNSFHGKVKNEVGEKVYAGLSNTNGSAQVKYLAPSSKVLTFGTQASNNINYYYGYNPKSPIFNADTVQAPLLKDSIENQIINFLKIHSNLQTNYLDSNHVNYNVDIDWQTLSGKQGVGENVLRLNGNLNYFFENEFIGVDMALNYYTNTGIEDTINGAVVKFSPWIGAFGNKWQTVVGLSTYYDQQTEKYFLYPKVSMHYNIIEYFLIPYLELDGDYIVNSYRDIYEKNSFIRQNLGVKPTDTKLNLTFGFRGNISSKVAFNAKINYSKINNQYFFVNDTSELVPLQNKFAVVYDDIDRLRLLAEVSYKTGEKLFLTLKGNYYEYQMTNEAKPWHMPNYTVSLNARYLIQKKITLDANIFAIGERTVRDFDAGLVMYDKTLQGIVDFNLGAEYRLSKVFSSYIYFNNISSAQYYTWNHYAAERFNVVLGISYSF